MAKLTANVFLSADEVLGGYSLAELMEALKELQQLRRFSHQQQTNNKVYEYEITRPMLKDVPPNTCGGGWQKNPETFKDNNGHWYRETTKTDG